MKNPCKVAPRVQEYLDGLMSGHTLRSFEAHVERCASCRADLIAYRKLYASLESMPLQAHDASLTDRVLARVLGDADTSPCAEGHRVQDYLDGLLPVAAFQAFEGHLQTCARCTADVSRYRQVFTKLERMPLLSPSAGFTERVLARVVPARIRARWVRVIGWGYAAACAAFVGAIAVVLGMPGTQGAIEQFSGDATGRFTGVIVLAMQAFSVLAQAVAGAWGFALGVVSWFAPVGRALAPLVANATVISALGAAGVACTVLIWWMHTRESNRATEKVKHVALLGF